MSGSQKVDDSEASRLKTPSTSFASFSTQSQASFGEPSKNSFSCWKVPRSGLREIMVSFLSFVTGFYGLKIFQPSQEDLDSRVVPYQVLSSGDVILNFELNHPVISSTIPSHLLHLTATYIPMTVLLIGLAIGRLKRRHLCGFFTALGISEAFTHILKIYVGRMRPNFYQLCQFSVETLKCMASYHDVKEAQHSFPSGHSSLTACSMMYLIWCICKSPRLPVFYKFFMSVCLATWALFVASSRIVDRWHHPSDVLAGILLGVASATASHKIWFPDTPHPRPGESLLPLSKLPSFHE